MYRFKNKIGFYWPRTNAAAEQKSLYNGSLAVQSELQDIDLYKIKRVFENVIRRGPKKEKVKSDLIYIYALIDPRDLEIRYIGKTNNPKERMRAHISPHIYMRNNNKKCIWMESLKALKLKPIMTVLTSCSEEESINYEYMYWKLFKDSCDLLNSQEILKETFQMDIKFKC